MRVFADFLADVRAQLLDLLDDGGFPVPLAIAADSGAVARLYFNVRMRLLPPRRWRVLTSRELATRSLPPQRSRAVAAITARAREGKTLAPFLSRRLRDPEYNDALLNEWGIHHFHLGGVAPEPDGFMPRTRELLFAFAHGDALHLVDVRDHGSFVDDELVEIMHANWPRTLETFRADGFSRAPGDDRTTSDVRRVARRRGLTILTEVSDGTLYVPLGGGYASAGNSTLALRRGDRLLYTAKRLEHHCRERATELAQTASARAGRPLWELHLNLQLGGDGEGMSVIETQSGYIVCVRA